MALTAKEEKFCQEYDLCGFDAYEAAKKCNIQFQDVPVNYYVYFLINPINNQIFYVGKGKGNRKDQHLQQHGKKHFINARKHMVIETIIKAGLLPVSVIFQNDLIELDSFSLELMLITELKPFGITNITSGHYHPLERSKELAQLQLRKILSFDKWVLLKSPSEYEKELYFHVVDGLKEIAVHGSITHIICTTTSEGSTVRYE